MSSFRLRFVTFRVWIPSLGVLFGVAGCGGWGPLKQATAPEIGCLSSEVDVYIQHIDGAYVEYEAFCSGRDRRLCSAVSRSDGTIEAKCPGPDSTTSSAPATSSTPTSVAEWSLTKFSLCPAAVRFPETVRVERTERDGSPIEVAEWSTEEAQLVMTCVRIPDEVDPAKDPEVARRMMNGSVEAFAKAIDGEIRSRRPVKDDTLVAEVQKDGSTIHVRTIVRGGFFYTLIGGADGAEGPKLWRRFVDSGIAAGTSLGKAMSVSKGAP